MSNNHHDERVSMVVPTGTDWDELDERVENFEPSDYSPTEIDRAFWWYHQNRGELSREDYRRALREDLFLIRQRYQNAHRYARDTESYSMGYGFDHIRVLGNTILIGTYNEHNAGVGEVTDSDMEIVEYEVFSRWTLLGLLPSAKDSTPVH